MESRNRAQKNYVSLSLQKALAEEIRAYLSEHPEEGYTGITDFVRGAVRTKLKGEGGK
jgi:hypothetical protein